MALRIPYFSQYVFVGPSPASGYHFLRSDGVLNNDFEDLGPNSNLLMGLHRVQNVTFAMEAEREEVRQLGTRSTVDRPNINPPKVSLEFEYLLNGLANDARIGLNVNYGQFHFPYSGTPFYDENFNVSLLSGLIARQFTQPTGQPFWPMAMRDNRNIFLVRAPEGQEIQRLGEHRLDQPDLTQGIDFMAPRYEVLAFGNCYLESWETSAAVNAIPRTKTSWAAENVCFYVSGSGCNIPAISTTTRQLINQNKFIIPEVRNEGGPFILNPGDILLDISASGANGNLTGFGLNFNDITIQDYSIRMDLNRDLLMSLGHKCALDREITFPVIAILNFGAIVGNVTSGHFIDILNEDNNYDITIKLRNPLINPPFTPRSESTRPFFGSAGSAGTSGGGSVASSGTPRHSGPAFANGDVAIRYDLKGAKFNSVGYSTAIGSNKRAEVSFSVELDPDNLARGLFISGLLNIEKIEDYLIDESGNYILDEQSNAVVGNLIPLY